MARRLLAVSGKDACARLTDGTTRPARQSLRRNAEAFRRRPGALDTPSRSPIHPPDIRRTLLNVTIALGLLGSLTAVSGCIRLDFDLCAEEPPHADCLDAELDAGLDAGLDGASSDSGTDGAFDGGLDGAFDGGLDGAFDGGLDGAFDGAFDGGLDGAFDGGSDAGVDASSDAGSIGAG